MPIYEYLCPRCGHRFEELQRMGDPKAPPCGNCGCARTERQFSTFAMSAASPGGGGGSSSCPTCARSSCAGCGQ